MAQVKLILREDVPNLGEAGDVVSVKPGYARNFLIPRGKAHVATESNVKQLEHHQRVIQEKLAKQLSDLEAVRNRIQSLTLEVSAQAGEGGRLFGSVTAQQISDLLAERGSEVDRRKIALSEPIKEIGEHRVSIRLRRDVIAEVVVKVSAIGQEPASQDVSGEESADGDRTS
jgi:large subunit ribosomal protein L9